MNAIRWVGRKVFYTESLAERQIRKLGKIDLERAKLHNNDELPIVRPEPQEVDYLEIEGIPFKGLPPTYMEAVKKTYTNNKKKKRNGKKSHQR